MGLVNEDLDALEKKLDAAEKTVSEVDQKYRCFVDFAVLVTKELGERTEHKVEDYNVKSTYELGDFYGFDIRYHDGFSYQGGASVTIKYKKLPVLEIEYWNIDELQVKSASAGEWERKLGEIIEQKDAIITTIKLGRKMNEESESRRITKHNALIERKEALKAKAARLKVPLLDLQ